jgi:hypothetical protein
MFYKRLDNKYNICYHMTSIEYKKGDAQNEKYINNYWQKRKILYRFEG